MLMDRGFSFLFVMFLLIHAGTATTCDELHCLNSNPCQSTISRDNSTHARCLCGGKWAGLRCEQELVLKTEALTSSTVTLKVGLIASQNSKNVTVKGSAMSLVSQSGEQETKMSYTLVYWKRNDNSVPLSHESGFMSGKISCVLLHKKDFGHPVLEGLWPLTSYAICIENGFVDSCVLSSIQGSSLSQFLPGVTSERNTSSVEMTSTWPSNCVTITTPKHFPRVIHVYSSTVTSVAAVSIVVVVAVVGIAVLVFFIRRHSVSWRLLMDNMLGGCCCCRCCYRRCHLEERTYVSQFSTQQRSTSHFCEVFAQEMGVTTLLRKLRCCRKTQTPSPSNMSSLLPAPSSLPETLDCYVETSPLNFRHSQGAGLVSEQSSEQVIEYETTLPANQRLRNNRLPKQRLSGNRHGYVTYSTKKDRVVQLTTVLESPLDEETGGDLSVSIEVPSTSSNE